MKINCSLSDSPAKKVELRVSIQTEYKIKEIRLLTSRILNLILI